MAQLYAGSFLEQVARQVNGGAVAGRAISDGARRGLGGRHHVGQRFVLGVDTRGDDHGRVRHVGHGRQVLGGVPRQVLVQPGADDQIVLLAHDDVIACGSGLHRLGNTDGAASSRLVVGHHGPFVGFRQLGGDQAGQDVGAAAGREGHDQTDGLGGIGAGSGCTGLGMGGHSAQGTGEGGKRKDMSTKHGEKVSWRTWYGTWRIWRAPAWMMAQPSWAAPCRSARMPSPSAMAGRVRGARKWPRCLAHRRCTWSPARTGPGCAAVRAVPSR